MRRISLVVVILIILGALSAPAAQLPREREERGTIQRVVRAVKSMFRPRTNSDILMPPTPAPQPRP